MNTHKWFYTSLALTSGACSLPHTLVAQQKPHIILLMADQHRGDAMNCMGNPSVITPNMDALACEGTLFTNGYSSTPSSTPARAGLLSGLSPRHHGMLGYGRVGQQYRYEMPQMLRDLGYYTFGIGKMHWYPQKSLHGFHGTLVDESGHVESDDFISDYRLWFLIPLVWDGMIMEPPPTNFPKNFTRPSGLEKWLVKSSVIIKTGMGNLYS